MSKRGRRSSSGDRQVVSLKVLVDKTKNRVIFAESDNDFIDILFSFLTLPMGTVVGLLGTESNAIGSIARIHRSVSALETRHSRTAFCKAMLLNPRNASEAQCAKLSLNLNPMEPVKFYNCGLGYCKDKNWLTTFNDMRCKSGHLMDNEANTDEYKSTVDDDGEGDGVFIKGGPARFVITDDLQVMSGSTASCISLLRRLGINDGSEVEERTVEIGPKEVLCLLKYALVSKSPLTEAILLNQGSSVNDEVKFEQKKIAQLDKRAMATDSNSMSLKLLVSKSKKRVLHAEAGVDLVDFLFSFLTFPLGSIVKLLNRNSCLGCMDNLYKSAEDLSTGNYIKSEECTKMLVCPKLAPYFSLENQPLQIEEASYPQYLCDREEDSYPQYLYDCDVPERFIVSAKSSPAESSDERCLAAIMDPKSPTGETQPGKGFLRGPATFMITDNLTVTPLSPISSIALLNQLNLSINDVEERVLTVRKDEALNLLKASLISKTALSDVFYQRKPYPEVMLKV
uniref:DUF674 family protein n=1 Tax=Davidia involucrata TaxID=16924 RepID=A0A5B6YRD0_DAVIN